LITTRAKERVMDQLKQELHELTAEELEIVAAAGGSISTSGGRSDDSDDEG
jgi:hypothetical protein